MTIFARRILKSAFCIVVLASAVSCGRGEGSQVRAFSEEAGALLCRLNSALALCQNTDQEDENYGGLLCPRCGEYHTRSAEAVLPLAYEGLHHDTLRVRQALMLGGWLLDRQNPDGSWSESPRTGWTGTTADQLLSLAKAYDMLHDWMTDLQADAWRNGIKRAADYLAGFMGIDVAYVNYCATTAYALACADNVTGSSEHMDSARKLARFCISQINEDGLLEGEGDWNGSTKTGVDIGYNMEMSLWALLLYAGLAGDHMVHEAAVRSARAHSAFIYPGGWLDCSAGLRSCKWTLYGSATADGALPLYVSLASGGDPDGCCLKAALENVHALDQCFSSSGLLSPGPDYDHLTSEPPCIYHTFARAKGLALAMQIPLADELPPSAAACGRDTLAYFKTLNSVVVKNGPVKATICAYGYKSSRGRFMHRPSGGAVTMLWKDGRGVLQASSPNQYRRWEESFPEMPENTRSLTSRIEYVRDGVTYTNIYEYDATLEIPGRTQVTARGSLKSAEGESCGVDYEIRYTFDGDGLIKEYRVTGDDVTVIEPVVDSAGAVRQYYPSLCCREDVYRLKSSETLTIKY